MNDSESADAPVSLEQELFFGVASDRLRRRTRWAGVVLALSCLIPYEHVDGAPQFLWQILGELPPAAIVAAFSSSAAGLAILIASLRARRPATLAIVVLASLAAASLVERLGADRAAWDLLPLPDSLTDRPLSMLLGLSMVGAGLNLGFKPHTRRASRVVSILALLIIAAFYLWPARGEAPIATAFRIAIWMPLLPDVRFMMGYSLILMVMMFPACMAVLAALMALSPPSREPRLVSRLATYGLPALLGFFVFRSLLLSFGDSSLPATIGSVALLAALLGVASAAIEVLVELGVLRGQEPGEAPVSAASAGSSLWIPAAVASGALMIAGAAQWWLARPPQKGVEWPLNPASPEADAAFGAALDEWSEVRLRWDDRVRAESSATAMVELKAAERKVKDATAKLDPSVRDAVAALLLESRDLDLAGRAWFRLVADLNEANRATGAPYYVDPSVVMYQTPDGLRRRFSLHGFRIERVRPVRVGSERFATLHVRRLGERAGSHGLLGFSRDLQPFALVALDEIEPAEKELAALSDSETPSCSGREPLGSLVLPGFAAEDTRFGDLELERVMLDCGRAISDLVRRDRGALLPALVAMTERHELQHQIDGPHLPLPATLLDRMGGYTDAAQQAVSRELSAYVAELTTPSASPKLGLIALVRFTRSSPRSALHHVSVLAAQALSDSELGSRGGGVTAAELGRAYAALFALDDEALRARAREAWEDLYGDDLPEIADGA